MKIEKNYRGLSDAEAESAAIKDIKEYLGEERFNAVTVLLVEDCKENGEPIPLERFAQGCSLLMGIEGYPVKVWYELVFGKQEKANGKL